VQRTRRHRAQSRSRHDGRHVDHHRSVTPRPTFPPFISRAFLLVQLHRSLETTTSGCFLWIQCKFLRLLQCNL
jgi:hypothetical protein